MGILSTCVFVYLMLQVAQAGICSNGTIWQPASGTSFFWDLQINISTADIYGSSAQVFDFDLFYITHDMVSLIHSLNKTLICYIDTSYEPYRNDSYKFLVNTSVLGHDMAGWPGQKWVDIQSPLVRQIMADRLAMAAELGCDAIEWDDVDAYTNDNGFNLGPNDQLNFNLYLANITHSAGLSAGLKNDISQIYVLDDYFDWALDEQCYQYKECDTLLPFIRQHKAVFGAEYKGNAKKVCNALNNMGFSFIRTDFNVEASALVPCCQYETPPCPLKPAYCTRPPGDYPVYPDDVGTSAGVRLEAVGVVLVCSLLMALFV